MPRKVNFLKERFLRDSAMRATSSCDCEIGRKVNGCDFVSYQSANLPLARVILVPVRCAPFSYTQPP